MKRFFLLAIIIGLFGFVSYGAEVNNPILPGFNPDPSVCRVGDDYYLVTSSFMFYPGLPVYHSTDLVNWNLISHAIDDNNVRNFHFDGLGDNDGVWAPSIRYHDGKYYIAATLWRGGGNFILTADNPAGPWSDPVWVPGASGIDPSLFWDDDGKAYYIGNRFDFKQKWSGQVGIHIQEIDLDEVVTDTVRERKTGLRFAAPAYRLKGDNHIVSYGHASNAKYAEGPHLYKIGGAYLLLMAEGGSGAFHAVTAHWADSIFGPYRPQQINPVLTHRHFGNRYPVQNIGHADIVQTQNGDWYAVCLGNRYLEVDSVNSRFACPLGRETWLVEAAFQDGQLIMAPETGRVSERITAPALPSQKDCSLDHVYTPMTMKNLRLRKVTSHKWDYSRKVTDGSGVSGIILFRTVNGYYAFLKNKRSVVLRKVDKGMESVVAEIPFVGDSADLSIKADGMDLWFYCNGESVGGVQPFLPLCDDGKFNKFNGTGVGDILSIPD